MIFPVTCAKSQKEKSEYEYLDHMFTYLCINNSRFYLGEMDHGDCVAMQYDFIYNDRLY